MAHDQLSPGESLPVAVDLTPATRAMGWSICAVLALLVLWSIFAELHEGAIARGEVMPDGRGKTVQHLEGGIIREIRVRDGDAVRQGQDLVILDDSEARATLMIAETEQAARNALVQRLVAERDGRPYRPTKAVDQASEGQLRLFEIRRDSRRRELSDLARRIEQLRAEHIGWQKKWEALAALTGHAEEEKRINQRLFEQNFIARPRMLALDGRESETRASQGECEAEMARVRQRIGEAEAQIAKLSNDWAHAVLEDLRRAEDELAVAGEKVRVAGERLARTRVGSPIDGVVKGLLYPTLGAVVPPGGRLLDVIPVAEPMVIEARILPDDIDGVRIGTSCRVRLTAYKARAHLRMEGTVRAVSATTFVDEKSGMSYYTARVEIPENKLPRDSGVEMQPGMLAEVEIVGKARSPLRYLIDPISQNFRRAFKEE